MHPSVCPGLFVCLTVYIRNYQHGSHWTNFRGIVTADCHDNLLRSAEHCAKRTEISDTLHEDLSTFIYVAGDVYSPQKHCCVTVRVYILLNVTGSSADTHKILLHFRGNNGHTNEPWCCVKHVLAICLIHKHTKFSESHQTSTSDWNKNCYYIHASL